MRPRVFFIGPWWWNVSREEAPIAGTATLQSALVEAADVKRFYWPTFHGGPKVEPTWSAVVEEMSRQIPAGCHVIDAGPAGALTLLALSGRDDVRCLVMGGMFVPPATLRSLGMHHQAEGCSVFFRTTRGHQLARLNLQGAEEDFIQQVGELMDAGVDQDFKAAFQRSFESLNMLENPPSMEVPVLYVDPPLTAAGFAEMAEVLLGFVPHARIETTEVYPARMQEAATGLEYAEKALAFIDEVEQERD
jgi:hypothetical protein